MINSTLCYIEKDNKYLMLHRNRKEIDCNKGKWIGVGGKCETLETVPECLVREVREETGLRLKSWEARAIIYFISDVWDNERMFLFTAEVAGPLNETGKKVLELAEKGGETVSCDGTASDMRAAADVCDEAGPNGAARQAYATIPGEEGDLAWIPKEDVMSLNLWEGDCIFMQMMMEGEPFFFMRLNYKGDELVDCHIGGETFKERVYEETARVPRGRVSTYGEIAVLAGHPGAARAVGNALHENPYEGVIPCHRIVNAAGRPAPYFVFGGPERQLRLLRAEGVKIANGHVVL